MLRGEVSDFLSIPVANVLRHARHDHAYRRYQEVHLGKTDTGWDYTLLVPIFISYWYFTYIVDDMILRAFISTIFLAPCLIIAGILASDIP